MIRQQHFARILDQRRQRKVGVMRLLQLSNEPIEHLDIYANFHA
jgi:hypothetical protein